MNFGPLIFLGAFFVFATSWYGYVLKPQLRLGQMQPAATIPAGVTYPVSRDGLARQGAEVYRANGCAYCHSQQVRQTATVCDVVLTDKGTNAAALQAAVGVIPGASTAALNDLSQPLLRGVSRDDADAALRKLKTAGAKVSLAIRPIGSDIERGWGRRRSVAEDFLYDSPVLFGAQRIGPDLANAGVRLPDANWHYRHLYAPRAEVAGSTMAPYKFLFEQCKIVGAGSPDAVAGLKAPYEAPAGYEIVPRPEARALVAYLLSLRADAPLFDAPIALAAAPASISSTNAPAK